MHSGDRGPAFFLSFQSALLFKPCLLPLPSVYRPPLVFSILLLISILYCRSSIFLPVLSGHTLSSKAVFRIRIRIRIHVFFGLPDPDPLVRGMDPDPAPGFADLDQRIQDLRRIRNFPNHSIRFGPDPDLCTLNIIFQYIKFISFDPRSSPGKIYI
jgi:hypothetical protein